MKNINEDIIWSHVNFDIYEIFETTNKSFAKHEQAIFTNINGKDNDIDDFKGMFDHLSVKIITVISFLICQLFNNTYNVLVSLFEKYGSDPLKRTVSNQLLTQIGHMIIMHNIVCSTLWTWRIIVGPLNLEIAEFESFIQSCFLVSVFLNFAEVAVIKASTICKWTVVTGMNDQFIATFIQNVNVGFIAISQMSRYMLGTMHETLHFQLLTGFKFGLGIDYFWPYYLASTLFITGTAFSIIKLCKFKMMYKNWKIQQNININLNNLEQENELQGCVPTKYNNLSKNPAIMTSKGQALLIGFVGFLGIFFYLIQNLYYDNEMDLYKWLVFREFFVITVVVKMIIPVTYLVSNKNVLDYICMMIEDVFPPMGNRY